MLTMTEFGKREIQKSFPEIRFEVIPHIVDPQIFYQLDKKIVRA